MSDYFLRNNDEEECWELLERGALHNDNSDPENEDALLARFYDGDRRASPLAEVVLALLQEYPTILTDVLPGSSL